MSSSMRDWLRLPSRIAMLLGLGVLSAAHAKAGITIDAPPRDAVRVPQQGAKAFGDLLIWHENERIYVSEAGQPAEELRLGDSAETASLKRLLKREGATAATPHALRDRIILVGSGGDGFHLEAVRRPDSSKETRTLATNRPNNGPSDKTIAREQIGAAPPPSSVNDSK